MNRYTQALRALLAEFSHPKLDFDGRRLIGIFMTMNGLTRLLLPHLVALDFMSDRVYGALSLSLGVGLLVTLLADWQWRMPGRLIALGGAALLCALAIDLTPRANGFWAFLVLAFVLFREAVRR